jgi:hypothetical protein
MLRTGILLVLTGCLISLWSGCVQQEDSDEAVTTGIRAGVAVTDITPPEGYGQYRGESTGTITPLRAKALVFKQGDERAALVICDLIRITRDLSSEARTIASAETGIPYNNIIVTATHTHTGPEYRYNLADYVNRKDAGELTADDRNSYSATLVQNVAQAVIDADASTGSVQLQTLTAQAHGVSFNRRFLMKNGRVVMNPGSENPSIVEPMGPIDPDVTTLMIRESASDGPLAALTVFANHLDTVGGTEWSADYPYYMAQSLKEELGREFVSVFGLGTCGDINHIDVSSTPSPTTREIGNTLGNVIRQELSDLEDVSSPSLAVRSETIYAPMQSYSEAELAWAQNETDGTLYEEGRAQYRRYKILNLKHKRERGLAVPPTIDGEPWTLPLEVQVMRLSENAAIVALPGEVFVELGLAIKNQSPFATTQVIELANSNVYYVPTKKAFREGSYETINSRISPGGGEMLVDTAVDMLDRLHEGQ